MKTEKRIFAYPIEMKGHAKEELIKEAEALGLVWSVDGFLEELNKDQINAQDYYCGTYEVEVFDQDISYILVGEELVDDFVDGDAHCAAQHLKNDGTGELIEYDRSEPLYKLLNAIAGYWDFIEITPEEARIIKSHLKE